jgi:hypothetical protein
MAEYEAQVRAKYTQAEVDTLGAKGHALKDDDGEHYSYPIDDLQDLKRAIKAVGRGSADHDKIRKYIIGRAKGMGKSALIPENWNSDGSIKPEAKSAEFLASQWREGQSYSDLQDMLSSAVSDKFRKDDDDYTYVCDFDDDNVVFCQNGEKFQTGYTVDGNDVKLDKKPTAVKVVTTYVPIETKSSEPAEDPIPAVPKKYWALREMEPPIVADFQVRAEGEAPTEAELVGWPSTTGNGYDVMDWMGEYTETIMPGAFAKTLKESDYIPYLVDHKGDVLSSWPKTMDLGEDSRGLRSVARLDIAENTSSRNLYSGVKRGDYSKMSFAFRATKEDWDETYTKRSVLELQLFDCSVVKSPANKLTTVGLRSDVQDILGREGVMLFRSASLVYGQFVETRSLAEDGEPIFDDLIRSLKFMDERMCAQSQYMYCSRARTFAVVGAIEQLRQGKVLSSANEQLLKDALDALGQGDNGIKAAATGNAEAQTAIRATLGQTEPTEQGGAKASNNGGLDTGKLNDGNPVLPNDGAGVRMAKAQVELLKLRSKK